MWSNSIKRKALIFAILSTVLSFLFVHSVWAGPKYGGSLRMINEGDSNGFDVINARGFSSTAQLVGNLVMERLFELGPDNKRIPALGLSATQSKNGKIWTVKLRQGVKFHDGTSFNADAVVNHWQRILDPKSGFRGKILLGPLKSVEKAGEYEVRFLLEHSWAPFSVMILTNKRSLASLIPSPKAVKGETQNRAPIGTGPFIFKEWKSGNRIVVTRNPNYRVSGKPYLDKIIIRNIPDHEARYIALLSGQVEMILTDRPSHVKKLTQNPKFKTIVTDTGSTGILMMNTSKPPLDDLRVRQALAYAWDQEQYIKVVFNNIVDSAEYLTKEKLNCSDYGYLDTDISKARNLIAAYGKPVELEYFHSQTQRGKETALVMQQLFNKIDVKLKASPLGWGGIIKKLFSGNYDISSWVIPGFDDIGPISMASFNSKSPWNLMKYKNKKVDELLHLQRMSDDPAVRRKSLCDIARKINSDAPFLYLFKQRFYVVFNKGIQGIISPRNENIRLANAWLEK